MLHPDREKSSRLLTEISTSLESDKSHDILKHHQDMLYVSQEIYHKGFGRTDFLISTELPAMEPCSPNHHDGFFDIKFSHYDHDGDQIFRKATFIIGFEGKKKNTGKKSFPSIDYSLDLAFKEKDTLQDFLSRGINELISDIREMKTPQ